MVGKGPLYTSVVLSAVDDQAGSSLSSVAGRAARPWQGPRQGSVTTSIRFYATIVGFECFLYPAILPYVMPR